MPLKKQTTESDKIIHELIEDVNEIVNNEETSVEENPTVESPDNTEENDTEE